MYQPRSPRQGGRCAQCDGDSAHHSLRSPISANKICNSVDLSDSPCLQWNCDADVFYSFPGGVDGYGAVPGELFFLPADVARAELAPAGAPLLPPQPEGFPGMPDAGAAAVREEYGTPRGAVDGIGRAGGFIPGASRRASSGHGARRSVRPPRPARPPRQPPHLARQAGAASCGIGRIPRPGWFPRSAPGSRKIHRHGRVRDSRPWRYGALAVLAVPGSSRFTCLHSNQLTGDAAPTASGLQSKER